MSHKFCSRDLVLPRPYACELLACVWASKYFLGWHKVKIFNVPTRVRGGVYVAVPDAGCILNHLLLSTSHRHLCDIFYRRVFCPVPPRVRKSPRGSLAVSAPWPHLCFVMLLVAMASGNVAEPIGVSRIVSWVSFSVFTGHESIV